MRNFFDSGLQGRPTSRNPGLEGVPTFQLQSLRSERMTDGSSGSFISLMMSSRPSSSADHRSNHAITRISDDQCEGQPREQAVGSVLGDNTKPHAAPTAHGSVTVAPAGETPAPVKVKKKRIRIKTERRREQCRLNQARYRNKQRSFAVGLEHTVAQLRQQVLQLEAQRRSLNFSVNTRDSATRAAMEYFKVFGGGLTVYEPRPGSSRPSLEQQILFVTSSFHHSVRVGDDYSTEFFLEQWRRFSTFYDGVRLIPQQFTHRNTPEVSTSVETKVIMQVTITQTTIRQLYPHLQRPQYNEIRWKLLGQRINFNSVLEFVFDGDGKVASVEWTIDFVEAFRRLLTIDETADVLQQAQVVRDAYLLRSEEGNMYQYGGNEYSDDFTWRSSTLEWGGGEDEGYLIHDGKGDDYVMV